MGADLFDGAKRRKVRTLRRRGNVSIEACYSSVKYKISVFQ